MLQIKIGQETFTLATITVRKLNQTMKFKKKFDILQAQGDKEAEMFDAMVDYLVEVFSIKKGEEVEYAFDADYILDNLPLSELQSTFQYTINTIMSVFAGESTSSKN